MDKVKKKVSVSEDAEGSPVRRATPQPEEESMCMKIRSCRRRRATIKDLFLCLLKVI